MLHATIPEHCHGDFLKRKGVSFGGGNRDFIQGRLIIFLCFEEDEADPLPDSLTSIPWPKNSSESPADASIRDDFLKISCYKEGKFTEQHEVTLSESVRHQVENVCRTTDIVEDYQLGLVYKILISEQMRFVTSIILYNVSTVDEAFENLQDHYIF